MYDYEKSKQIFEQFCHNCKQAELKARQECEKAQILASQCSQKNAKANHNGRNLQFTKAINNSIRSLQARSGVDFAHRQSQSGERF